MLGYRLTLFKLVTNIEQKQLRKISVNNLKLAGFKVDVTHVFISETCYEQPSSEIEDGHLSV